jgi:succinoglycan biosynthesis transport protein ExoP
MSFASQATQGGGQFSDGDLDLSALGSTLWRQRWRIFRPALLVGLATLLVVEVITPRYQSESRVIVEGRDNIFLRPDADKDIMDRNIDQEGVTSQAQVILSRDLAIKVIEKLKLNERSEFDATLGVTSPIRAVLGLIGLTKNPLSMTPEERVLEAYYDRLTVFPVDKSRVIVIDFLSEDPEFAAKVANTIADTYLELQRQVKQQQARTAGEVLSGEIYTLRKKVVAAEANVEAYRAKSNLLVGNNNTTLSAQQLGDMTAQLSAARAQKADAEAKSKLIRDMIKSNQPIESSDVLNSELIRRLSEQRVTLRAQLAEQSSSLLDSHPRIKELKAQVADLDHQITDEAAIMARSFENDAKIAGARVDTLSASLDQLKNQAATTNEDDVQLRELERDAKSQRDLLESYLAKYREATARDTLNSAPADARVISRGTVSNVPAYPKKLPTVLIAVLTTMIVASGFVLTRELLGAPAGAVPVPVRRAPTAMEAAATSRMAAATSRVATVLNSFRNKISRGEKFDGESVVRAKAVPEEAPADPASTIEEIAGELRSSGGTGEPIAVMGAAQGMDTSWIALKLARALGVDGRVLLVGLGSADAAVRATSSNSSAPGLAELASGAASFRDIITKDQKSNVHLISSGAAPTDRGEIVSSPTVASSFDALSQSYDYVVVAAGAIVGSELDVVASIAPYAVLVAGTLSGSGAAAARERLLSAGFHDVILVADGPAAASGAVAAA